jgi:hypothetical protein
MEVFDLTFQRKVMGPDFDLIPRGTSACRNFEVIIAGPPGPPPGR